MNHRKLGLAVFTCVSAAVPIARGDDLFRVLVSPEDSAVPGLSVGASSLPNLVEDLLDRRGQFAAFEGEAFAASLRFGGVDDAILFTLNAEGTRATVQFIGRDEPPLVFDAADGRDVEGQVIDFLEKDGSKTVADFLKAINRRSLVGVTDGNPLSTTAQMGSYKYNRFGKHQDLTRLERRIMRGEMFQPGSAPMPGAFQVSNGQQERNGIVTNGSTTIHQEQDINGRMQTEGAPVGAAHVQWFEPGSDRGLRVRFDAQGGIADADGFKSTFVNVSGSFEYRLNRFVGIAASFPISYYDVEGADVFTAGAHVDLPIRLIQRDDGKGFTFQFAPGALIAASGSYDMISGGVFWGLGATAMASYEFEDWLLSAAVGYTHFESITLKISDYEFDPDLTQDFVRVGGKATYSLGDNAYVFAGLSYSDFLKDAAIDNYFSPTVGVGVRTPGGFNVRLAYEGDFGSKYEAHKVQLGVQLPF